MMTSIGERRPRARRRERGFTLVEIMVVVVIIGLLATLVAQNVLGRDDEARLQKVKADLTTLREACDLYRLDHRGRFPDELRMLIEGNEKNRNYLKQEEVPKDPWDNEYRLDIQDGKLVVMSDGPDGQPETDDDINTLNMHKVTVEDLKKGNAPR